MGSAFPSVSRPVPGFRFHSEQFLIFLPPFPLCVNAPKAPRFTSSAFEVVPCTTSTWRRFITLVTGARNPSESSKSSRPFQPGFGFLRRLSQSASEQIKSSRNSVTIFTVHSRRPWDSVASPKSLQVNIYLHQPYQETHISYINCK